MGEKICSRCKESKPLSEFYMMVTSSDGYRPECKECSKRARKKKEKDNPIDIKIYKMAFGIRQRTVIELDKPKNKTYKDRGIKCLLGNTNLEIVETLNKHFRKDIKKLIEEGKIPSVDRIDPYGHYELGNIQIIPLEDNVIKGCTAGVEVTSKPIVAIFPNGDSKEYKSVSECSRELGLKRDTIIRNRDNNTATRYGIRFVQFDDKKGE